MEAQGEKLLQDLIAKEQNLVAKVQESEAKAASMIKEAQAEAARILDEAKEKIAALTSEQEAKTQSESEEIHKVIIADAESAAAEIKKSATNNTDKAFSLVMERLTP